MVAGFCLSCFAVKLGSIKLRGVVADFLEYGFE